MSIKHHLKVDGDNTAPLGSGQEPRNQFQGCLSQSFKAKEDVISFNKHSLGAQAEKKLTVNVTSMTPFVY